MGGAVWVGLWHAVAALTGKLRYPRGQTGPRVRGSRSGCCSTVLLQDADHSASPASWPQEIRAANTWFAALGGSPQIRGAAFPQCEARI